MALVIPNTGQAITMGRVHRAHNNQSIGASASRLRTDLAGFYGISQSGAVRLSTDFGGKPTNFDY